MDYELLKPWIIVLGYAVAVGVLVLGSKLAERADASPDDRWRTAARLAYSAAGFVASATTLFWATLGTFSGPAMVLWAVFPAAVAALVWWRSYRQREWMDRVAGRRGVQYSRDNPGRPSFGVLPAGGSAVGADDPRAGFESAVELDMRGLRVLGVQYTFGDIAPTKPRKKRPSKFLEAVDRVGNTYGMVQLRTPSVPTLVITPRPTDEQHKDFGPLEPSEFRPFEDARLTRNIIGGLTPEGELRPVDLADGDFTRRFSVRAADAEFAAAVLTPEVRQRLTSDPLFSTREVVFHNGALWTAQFGELTEEALVEDSRRLTRLAATVPPNAWHHGAPGPLQPEQFTSALREADAAGELRPPAAEYPALKWLAWLAVLAAILFAIDLAIDISPTSAVVQFAGLGVIPAVAAAVRHRFNVRREAVGRTPLRTWSLTLRTIVVLALLIPGAALFANSTLAITGLAAEVDLTVTEVACDANDDGDCGYDISGNYRLDGEVRRVEGSNWMQWRMFGPLPEEGDVIEIAIGPLWWQPMIESTGVGVFLLFCGLGLLLVGLLAAKLLFNLSPRLSSGPAKTGGEGTNSGAPQSKVHLSAEED